MRRTRSNSRKRSSGRLIVTFLLAGLRRRVLIVILSHTNLRALLWLLAIAQDLRRHPRDDRVIGDVVRHDRAGPDRLAERAQQHTPLARAVGAIEVGRGRVALEEGLARLALAQAGRLRDLVGRIGRDLLDAVDRLDRSRRQWLLANSRIEVVTRSICSSVSSGYMGIESTSSANRSVMGRSPLRYPRNSADCCRWIGTG